ncbi:MAG: helix-turn-helix domain-containing protein [Ruminococcus sp.]|nr:helix-turn-helix domain-containing protein [Ruminococcus sp.]
MNSSTDFFNGKFIHIDNIIHKDVSDSLLYVPHAGYFTSDNCPRQKKQREGNYFFMITTKGKGLVKYDGVLHNVSEGECVFLDCNLPHYYLPDPEDPWEVTWVNFAGHGAEYYYRIFIQQKSNIFLPQNFEIIRILLTKIVDNNLHRTEATDILNAKLITDLMTSVLLNNNNYDDCTNKVKHKLYTVREYLDENFTNSINLDELSDIFFISKFYLTREFKKTFGTTIIQYILNKRIEYAKELLVYTNKSVEEISDACGFSDQSYFSRQFKKAENMTCLAYRKKHM